MDSVHPQVICYNSALSALEKGGEWLRALRLLREMQVALRRVGVVERILFFLGGIWGWIFCFFGGMIWGAGWRTWGGGLGVRLRFFANVQMWAE